MDKANENASFWPAFLPEIERAIETALSSLDLQEQALTSLLPQFAAARRAQTSAGAGLRAALASGDARKVTRALTEGNCVIAALRINHGTSR